MVLLPAWLVVLLHVLFGLAETVGWSEMARRFGYDASSTEVTRTLALNQGAYNIGLAGVLAWTLATGHTDSTIALLVFVIAMAAVGAATASRAIFLVQGVPALCALAALTLY